MEEWNDTIPEWVSANQASDLEVLTGLMEVAELLCRSPTFAFEGYPGTVEEQNGMEFQTIHLKDFDDIVIRMCKKDAKLLSMAVCPIGRDAPQIILNPPGIFMCRGSEE